MFYSQSRILEKNESQNITSLKKNEFENRSKKKF